MKLLLMILVLNLGVAALENKARSVEDLEEKKQGPDLV